MTPFKTLLSILSLLAITLVAGCARPLPDGPPPPGSPEVAQLTREILSLGPEVDPDEAARAARIAYDYTHQLAIEYQIEDPPLIHNMKVNNGTKPRGLCWHWAEDMENRLLAEDFTTLEMHRAIANADSAILIDHSTAIVSRRGDTMEEGVVLDPWRFGGNLFWSKVTEDPRYDWVPQQEVLQARAARIEAGGLMLPSW